MPPKKKVLTKEEAQKEAEEKVYVEGAPVVMLPPDLTVRSCGHVCKEVFVRQTYCDPCGGGGFCGCPLCAQRTAAA